MVWLRNAASLATFELQLLQLVTILEPLAKAVRCLEASRSTPSDVYIFWLAVMATYVHLFGQNTQGFTITLMGNIRAIVNGRYKQMIGGPTGLVYLATFYLNFGTFSPYSFFIYPTNPLCRVHPITPTPSSTE